jgi:hypothetical protein
MLITDLRHFDGVELDDHAPAAARRLAAHLRAVVRAATALPSEGRPIAVPCRRRPGRVPCGGPILAAVWADPPTVQWGCAACEDGGMISGWKGTADDLSPDPADEPLRVAALVSEDAYKAMLGCTFLDRSCERVVSTAEPVGGRIELCATAGEWEEFRDALAAEANHVRRPRQRRLDAAIRELEDALDPLAGSSRSGAPPAVAREIPELTRLAAEREVTDFCDRRVPPRARHQVRLDVETQGVTITMVERRLPYDANGPVDPDAWTRVPIAQLRWSADRLWRLYWCDAELRWHLDRGAPPTPDVVALLRRVDDDPSAVYWG